MEDLAGRQIQKEKGHNLLKKKTVEFNHILPNSSFLRLPFLIGCGSDALKSFWLSESGLESMRSTCSLKKSTSSLVVGEVGSWWLSICNCEEKNKIKMQNKEDYKISVFIESYHIQINYFPPYAFYILWRPSTWKKKKNHTLSYSIAAFISLLELVWETINFKYIVYMIKEIHKEAELPMPWLIMMLISQRYEDCV